MFGIFLVVLGLLFFLANNNLFIGWDSIWPIFPFLFGVFLLRLYRVRRKPQQLFVGTFLTLMGIFFFLFATGSLDWWQMDTLWPAFPLIFGVSLLVLSSVGDRPTFSLVMGVGFLAFSAIFFMIEAGKIASRVAEPVARIWPLVLVGAGILIILRRKRGEESSITPRESGTAEGTDD